MVAGNIFGASKSYPYPVTPFAPIYRGDGPPNFFTGYVGSIYIDKSAAAVYQRVMPAPLRPLDPPWRRIFKITDNSLINLAKWHGFSKPTEDLGERTDYFIQWCGQHGMNPKVYGPKQDDLTWPELVPNGLEQLTGTETV